MYLIAAVIVGLIPLVPAVFFFIRDRQNAPVKATREMVMGLNGFNVLVGMLARVTARFVLAAGLTAAGVTLAGISLVVIRFAFPKARGYRGEGEIKKTIPSSPSKKEF